MTIFSGAGKTASTFGSISKGVAGTFNEFALISFIFGTATAIAEWKEDIHKDGYDLAAALITTVIKAVIAAVLVALAVAAIVWIIMIALTGTIPVIAVGVMTIGAGFFVNYLVEAGDKFVGRAITHDQANTDGAASVIAPALREIGHSIQEKVYGNWQYLMHRMSSDYREIVF
jgi:hypothetical protein